MFNWLVESQNGEKTTLNSYGEMEEAIEYFYQSL